MRGRKTEVLQTTYLTHGRTSQPSAHRAPSSRAGSALPLPYPPVLQCFLRVTPFPAAIPAPQPAQRRSKQAVLMCLLLLLKFCLGRELTLIITPRAADRPIPASAGLRGTSGRGLKENATPRRGVNQRRTEFISSQRSAEHDPEGARGSAQDRPTGDTPRGAVGRSGAGCAQGQPRAAVPPRPRVLRAQALQLPPSLILLMCIIFIIIIIFLRPLRRSRGTHGPLSSSSSRPAPLRADFSEEMKAQTERGGAAGAPRARPSAPLYASAVSGERRGAGRQHLALLREPSPAVDRRISGREPRRSRRSPPSRAPPGRGDPRPLRGGGSESAAKAPRGRGPGSGSPRGAIPRRGGGGTGLAAPPAHRQLREHRVQSDRTVGRWGASVAIHSLPSDTWAPVVAPLCGRRPTSGPGTTAAALSVGPGRGSAGRGRAVGGEGQPRSPRQTE